MKSANVWKGLKDYSFLITYSSKGKLREIPIVFDLEDFFHLAGFQYANDIVLFKSSKTKTIDCISTISKELKISKSTVRRALHDLRRTGWIESEQRYREGGGKSSLLFKLKEI